MWAAAGLECPAAVLTDYHVHLRPDEDDTPAAEYFTPGNAERYREAAEERGIAELGVAEHIHRFHAALDVWQHPFWRKWAHDDLDEYCEFVREETDLRLGIEADFVAGARGPDRQLARARASGTTSSARCTSCATSAVDMRATASVWGRGESAEKVLEALLRDARRGRPHRHVRHHGPPRPGEGLGPRRAAARGRPAPLLRAGGRGLPEAGVAVEVSTAGLRKPVGEIYPSRRFLEMVVDAGLPDRALQRRARARPRRLRLRRRARAARAGRRSASCACSRAASAGSSRSAEIRTGIGDRHPPLRRRAAADPRRRRDPHERGPRGPLRRRRPDPRDHRRAARRRRPGRHRPALPRHRRALAGRRLAWTCCARCSPRSPERAGRSSTSTPR